MNHTPDLPAPSGSPFDGIRRVTPEGREYWSARDLMAPFGYGNWRDFSNAIDRAKIAAHNAGYQVTDHFAGALNKSTGGRPAEDYHLSRLACYLIAMNGDPRKQQVADAQTYFAIRTREAETAQPELPDRRALAQMVIDAEDRADAERAARQALEAPAAAWSHLASSHGDYSVSDAAKILSRDPQITTGRDRLFTFMESEGWIYRGAGERRKPWRAYQAQVDLGRLTERISRPYLNERTGEMTLPDPTVRITAKGLAKLHLLLGGSGSFGVLAVTA